MGDIIICDLTNSTAFLSAYSACYPETPTTRQLAVNPGNYVTTSLTTSHCEDACLRLGYSLAGLTAGKACFCGNTMTEAMASEAACVQTCAGDGDKCGTDGEPPYDSVYTTATTTVALSGFKIFPGGKMSPSWFSGRLTDASLNTNMSNFDFKEHTFL